MAGLPEVKNTAGVAGKVALAAFFLAVAVAIPWFAVQKNFLLAGVLGLAPVLLVVFLKSVSRMDFAFIILLVVNYFNPIAGRFIEFKGASFPVGLLLDGMIALMFFILMVQGVSRGVSLKHVKLEPVLVAFLWLAYCIFEGANLRANTEAWYKSIRNMALYFVAIEFLAQAALSDFKSVRTVLKVWAVLSLITAFYTFKQKFFGFSLMDKFFLYAQKGYITHIIHSGIRYFSIFSDAANMGGAMGVAATMSAILALSEKGWKIKTFYLFVALCCGLAMLYSGTRSALAVPFCGLAVYCVVTRSFKRVAVIGSFILAVFIFLNFTTIGEGNAVIRRARTVFDRNDASLQVRVETQNKLRDVLKDKPLGYGVGLSNARAATFGDQYEEIAQYAADSWFVQLWIETGIVGLIYYLCVMGYIILRGMYIVRFKLKDPLVTSYATALLCGLVGIFVMSSNNQVFAQFPNGVLIYTSIALIFLSPHYDKQVAAAKSLPDNGEL